MDVSVRIRNVLKALEFTPSILAQEAGISKYKANRILNGDKGLNYLDVTIIVKVTGIGPIIFFRDFKGGGIA